MAISNLIHPDLLVTSIPSWNQTSGSDTFSSLLKDFDSSRIANIYVRDGLPTSKVSSRYFSIDEMAVMKSCLVPNIQTGREVKAQLPTKGAKTKEKDVYRHRSRLLLWARELGWKIGKWNSKELNEFIESVDPEVLFFPIDNYPYFNRINEYIIQKYHPKKVIGYLWDDNFTYKQHPYNIFFKIERFFVRKQIRRLVASCTDILAISHKMKAECDKEFGINSIVLTKPIFDIGEFVTYQVSNPINILYTGKLNIGRDKSAIKVVEAIKEINKDGQRVTLDIYTNTILPKKIRKQIDVEGCCTIHPPVPQTEVKNLQENADILLFLEALSDKDLTARLSFSTKLTDYFAAGKCVWAIGNKDLGPISYIENEDAGFVSTTNEAISNILRQIVDNPQLIVDYAKKAFDCGRRNHDGGKILDTLSKVIYGR